MMKVLFLCRENSCRSIIAEAVLNSVAPIGWRAMSAGHAPKGELNSEAVDLLERHNISLEGLHSKSWKYLPQTPDLVISLCAEALCDVCPLSFQHAFRADWILDDPSQIENEVERAAAFEELFSTLEARIEALFELPIDQLVENRTAFQNAVEAIAL